MFSLNLIYIYIYINNGSDDVCAMSNGILLVINLEAEQSSHCFSFNTSKCVFWLNLKATDLKQTDANNTSSMFPD